MARHSITDEEIKVTLTGICPICGGKMAKPEKDSDSNTLFFTCENNLRMFKITDNNVNKSFSFDVYHVAYGVK